MKKQIARILIGFAFAAYCLMGGLGLSPVTHTSQVAFAEEVSEEIPNTTPITHIALSKTSASLAPLKTLKLTAQVTPAEANENYAWESSNEAVATVDANGLVTAVYDGTAHITAKSESGAAQASCTVTVKGVAVKSVKLNTKKVTVNLNKTYKLKATISPSKASIKTVTWLSSDEKIASVSSAGVVTANANGTVTITATAINGKKATCKVTVKTVAVKTVKLNKKSVALSPGGSYQLKATISPSSATYKTVSWSSSNEAVLTVDEKGKVTALKEGSATVTAKSNNGKKYSCKFKVSYIKVTKVKLNKTSLTLGPAATYSLKATVSPSTAHDKKVVWTSSNPDVAAVDQDGKVTATLKTGKATITAKAADGSGKKATCKVTVKITKVTKVKLNKTKASLGIGATYKLTAKITPSNAYDKTIAWKSSNENVATVDENGTVTAKNEGSATITALAMDTSGKKGTCKVTVKAVRVKTLKLDAALSVALNPEDTHTFTATISPTNASYPEITWKSSDPKIASVDENGTVTAVAKGLVTITASTDKNKIKVTRQVRVSSGNPPTYRALVLGSFNTRSIKNYMPFVNKDVSGMVSGMKNAGSYSPKYATSIKNKTQVKSAIQQAFGAATDDDVSILYLVTHGHNGKVSFEGGKTMTYLELGAMLKPIKGQFVVIVSACHSGSFISKLTSGKAGDELMSRINILSAAQNGVTCCGVKHSTEEGSADFFTARLLAGIGWDYYNSRSTTKSADANGDGQITVRELMTYTVANVPLDIHAYVAENEKKSPFTGNTKQVPQVYMSNPNLVLFE